MGTYPRIIERTDLPPAFIIEEDQIDTVILPQFPEGADIPFSILIDYQGRTYVEHNHTIYDSKKEKRYWKNIIRWFFDPQDYFLALADKIVAGSLIGSERRLIGGGSLIFYPKSKDSFCANWAALLPRQLKERGIHVDPQIREEAADRLVRTYEHFAKRLGARRVLGSTAIPASKQALERNGWKPIPRIPFHESWKLFWGTFPISLRMKSAYYQKTLT